MSSVATRQSSRVRTIVMCALSVALMAVSAWVTVPLGPVPFTLQVLAVAFVLFALKPKQALIAIVCYLLLGAIGLPVFSSFRGGVGVLMGPTGGFLTGYLVGGALALGVTGLLGKTKAFSSDKTVKIANVNFHIGFLVRNIIIAVIFCLVMYLFGWAQLAVVNNLTPEAAFAAAVAPFVGIDIAKIIAAIVLAQIVGAAVNLRD